MTWGRNNFNEIGTLLEMNMSERKNKNIYEIK
jgi:hypothetical protein